MITKINFFKLILSFSNNLITVKSSTALWGAFSALYIFARSALIFLNLLSTVVGS